MDDENRGHRQTDRQRDIRSGGPVVPPRSLKGFPQARRAPPKTARSGGGLRGRWKDDKGYIYEWDYQHGRVEKYDAQGRHLGEYDHLTGRQICGPVSGRHVEP
ncbi:colicin E3/pyocin S6 family cytotoxin [Skermanella aerolata]|uniref:colicin E3/pyocin S6 family cytotoxin n=1 Tax=Skermanella aerolata TaxID=393310 RepID=UPI003D22DB45